VESAEELEVGCVEDCADAGGIVSSGVGSGSGGGRVPDVG